jgi:hypothetical protein
MTTASMADEPSGFSVPVDEPEQVSLVERLEPVHLVHHLDVRCQAVHQPLGELEAEIERLRPDVEQQVAGRRDRRVPTAPELRERMRPRGSRLAEEAVPGLRAEPDDAAQLAVGDAEADRSPEPAHIGQHVADSGPRRPGSRRGRGRSTPAWAASGRSAARLRARCGEVPAGRASVAVRRSRLTRTLGEAACWAGRASRPVRGGDRGPAEHR